MPNLKYADDIIYQHSCMEDLEHKLRRSSTLLENNVFRDYLAYASLVRDPHEVYNYMEENKIGIDEPEFWTSKLNLSIKMAQYDTFVSLLKQIYKNKALRKHPKYWLIKEVEDEVQKQLQRKLRKRSKIRRSAQEYQLLNYSRVQNNTRKFGSLEVYIDPHCRMAYRLEDLALFVNDHLKDDCQFERNCFLRENLNKPLSFVGRKDEQFKKLSQELVKISQRDSPIKQTSARKSLKHRNSFICKTPEFKKKQTCLNRQSSVQILKHIARRSKMLKSPQVEDPQNDSYMKQKARNISPIKHDKGQEIDCVSIEGFSFGNYSDEENDETVSIKDKAFMNVSRSSSSHPQEDEAELQKVIKQFQLQRNQSQTMSEIDSNKQNDIGVGQIQTAQSPRRIRTLFETIRKQSQASSSLGYTQDQMTGDSLYRDLIEHIESGTSPHLGNADLGETFKSEQKSNRISRISEQRSYSYSETRNRSRSQQRH